METRKRFGQKNIWVNKIISRGSLYELETYLILCADIGYISEDVCNQLLDHVNECGKILNGLINYYEKKC